MDQNVIRFYETVEHEAERLRGGTSRVEGERTRDLLIHHLPEPPARVLDVGGGPGEYSFWLASKSYDVDLVDMVPKHIEQAKLRDTASVLRSASVGDAKDLDFDNDSMDAVLLMGPLYHLQKREDRLQALRESRRVLGSGGVLFVSAISRFASLLDGLRRGLLTDPKFREIVERDVADGCHHNPDRIPEYFTTAYFHRPEELGAEIAEAGYELVKTVGLEGPTWLLGDFDDKWQDGDQRSAMMSALRLIECEPALMGVSAHFLAIARKR